MRTRLLAKNPVDRKTREFTLTKADITIGSEPGNTVELRHETVSRRHALITSSGSTHEIRDLKSTNGTFVNEQRIERPTLLKNGDHIRVGALSFIYAGESPTTYRIGTISKLEGLLILMGVAFGLTYYFLNRQSFEQSPGAGPHRENVTSTSLQSQSQPRGATASNSSAGRLQPVARFSSPISPPPDHEDWLQRINYYRAMAGLGTIRDDHTLSGGCSDHARYLLENYGAILKGGGVLGSAGHEEERDKKDYSPQGAACAGEGNIGFGCGDSVTGAGAVDGWMGTPFHRLGILDPTLDAAGFGAFESQGCWASALRLPSHPKFGAYARPVEFPPQGSTIALNWPGGEWPNPLDGCPGYSEPVGLPITIQLGQGFFPNMTSHVLTQNGAPVEHCAYDAKGYSTADPYLQEYARQLLHTLSAVVLIPRHPLLPGKTYAVAITANGQNYRWSFTSASETDRSSALARK